MRVGRTGLFVAADVDPGLQGRRPRPRYVRTDIPQQFAILRTNHLQVPIVMRRHYSLASESLAAETSE